MKLRITLTLVSALLIMSAMAQKKRTRLVDHRHQADGWYVPVNGRVTAQGGDSKDLVILIHRDNELLGEITTNRGRFSLELDINHYYSITIRKSGYMDKLVAIDTSLPNDEVTYPPYDCFVNLEPEDKFRHADPFYLDFPSAIVRWVPKANAYLHSDQYLTNIQVKMALLQTQGITD